MLPNEAIQEFKQIYLKEEGVSLSDQEATALANNIMGLFREMLKTGSKFEHATVGGIDK